MELSLSIREAQAVLKQRNMLMLFSLGLMVLNGWTWIELRGQEEKIILIPTLGSEVMISNRGVSADYLERVTRDVVALMLNRTPRSLPYFQDQLLRIVHPGSYGDVKSQLVKMADEARTGDISTVFFPVQMNTDPVNLTSDVTGELQVYVGKTRVAKDRRHYRMTWNYAGMRLSLLSFEDMDQKETSE
ncbi:MAG: type IV conjugative transfer system protein TraE [Emcibacter sp.]|nr:type IV conjugative transfer system protein TraE [Emcibacter sp.]